MGRMQSAASDPKAEVTKRVLLIDISPCFRHDPVPGGISNSDFLHRRAQAAQRPARWRAYVAVAWLLIQVAQTVFPAFGFGETALRVVIVVLAIGLLPVLVFAWAFELTPEGLKRESEIDRSQSVISAHRQEARSRDHGGAGARARLLRLRQVRAVPAT